ncbi:hypothetical protein ACH4TX_12300 [Streptomyces sp. NPDC021098]|uniref:hypothetical protein n=1 Tax=unclassified Streptomyces TaxID=2593676 RepID=UPI0037B16011
MSTEQCSTSEGNMSMAYEYFLVPYEVREGNRTGETFWRRLPGTEEWQFLSFWDWEWHKLAETAPRHGSPQAASLQPVSPEQAAELENNRSRWSLYWAVYPDTPKPGDQPVNVVRRKLSPDKSQDQIFGRDNQWVRTTDIFDFYSPWPTDPPHLEPVDAHEAERIIMERRGISGATSW